MIHGLGSFLRDFIALYGMCGLYRIYCEHQLMSGAPADGIAALLALETMARPAGGFQDNQFIFVGVPKVDWRQVLADAVEKVVRDYRRIMIPSR
jgi:hypothetical protein